MSEIPREAVEAFISAYTEFVHEDNVCLTDEAIPVGLEAALPYLSGLHLTTEEIDALYWGKPDYDPAMRSAREKLKAEFDARAELERRNG